MIFNTRKTLAVGLTALALTLSLTPVSANKTTYLDVNDEIWYSNPIAFCQQHGLMDGVAAGEFQPKEPLTRAALAESLYRLARSPAPEGEGNQEAPAASSAPEETFSDVTADHPNFNAITWAKSSGAVSGYPDGTFRPENPITREEVAVLLWNGRGKPEAAGSADCIDRDSISPWALEAVDWAYGERLLSGNSDGSFAPRNNITRGEGATVIMRCGKVYYGLTYGYPLPEPRAVPANSYDNGRYQLDENGYLSYQGGWYARGVDVSAHQKEIDWRRVAAAGMDFAMIRAGYRGYTLGTITKDEYFDANMSGALANGMDVGVYFFSQALTPAEAEEEARVLLEWIGDYKVTYPVVFDWEEQDKENSRTRNTDGNTVTACALAFCRVIKEAGYTPMTYGSPSKIYEGGLALEYLGDYPAFWLAHYTKETLPTSFRYHYDIWQYSSSGAVDGIEGNVDLNIALTNYSPNSSQLPPDWWKYPPV